MSLRLGRRRVAHSARAVSRRQTCSRAAASASSAARSRTTVAARRPRRRSRTPGRGIGALLGSPRHPSRVRHAHRRSETRSPAPGLRTATCPRSSRARRNSWTRPTDAPSSAAARYDVIPRTVVRGCRTTVDARSSDSLARRDPTPSPRPRPTDLPFPPARDAQPEDDSRHARQRNQAPGRSPSRGDPDLTDAGERDAWTAQLVFLEEDVASAVERVTGAAEPAAGPAPSLDSPNPTVPVAPGGIFAGLDVSPANATPTLRPRCRRLRWTSSAGWTSLPTPTVSAPTDAGAGIDVAPPPPMSSTPSGVAGLGALDESMFASSVPASDKTLLRRRLRRALGENRDRRCASGTLATRTTSTSFRASERATRRDERGEVVHDASASG